MTVTHDVYGKRQMKCGKGKVWSAEADAFCLKLIKEGISAEDIARRLNRMGLHESATRAGVIGRAHRLGRGFKKVRGWDRVKIVEGEEKKTRSRTPVRPRPTPVEVEQPLSLMEPLPTPGLPDPAPIELVVQQPVSGPNVQFVKSSAFQCLYPLWTAEFKTGLVCGEARRPGSSYCVDHHELCNNRVPVPLKYRRRLAAE